MQAKEVNRKLLVMTKSSVAGLFRKVKRVCRIWTLVVVDR